jgi:hypothetical protein
VQTDGPEEQNRRVTVRNIAPLLASKAAVTSARLPPNKAGERQNGASSSRTGRRFFSVVSAVRSIVGQDDPGIPTRSKEERLVSLIARDKRVGEISHLLATRPITWQAMRTAYESVVGIATGNRKHYRKIVDKGWLTIEESNTFYDTASFHTHGHPRTAPEVRMEYEAAVALSKKIVLALSRRPRA